MQRRSCTGVTRCVALLRLHCHAQLQLPCGRDDLRSPCVRDEHIMSTISVTSISAAAAAAAAATAADMARPRRRLLSSLRVALPAITGMAAVLMSIGSMQLGGRCFDKRCSCCNCCILRRPRPQPWPWPLSQPQPQPWLPTTVATVDSAGRTTNDQSAIICSLRHYWHQTIIPCHGNVRTSSLNPLLKPSETSSHIYIYIYTCYLYT